MVACIWVEIYLLNTYLSINALKVLFINNANIFYTRNNTMQNDLIHQWAELNKVTTNAIKELGEINTNAMSRLTQRQMEMMNLYMEGGAKQLESLDETKDIQDIVATQSRLFEEFNTKLTENARQTASELTDVKDKLSAWAEKNTEVAAANLSKYTDK